MSLRTPLNYDVYETSDIQKYPERWELRGPFAPGKYRREASPVTPADSEAPWAEYLVSAAGACRPADGTKATVRVDGRTTHKR